MPPVTIEKNLSSREQGLRALGSFHGSEEMRRRWQEAAAELPPADQCTVVRHVMSRSLGDGLELSLALKLPTDTTFALLGEASQHRYERHERFFETMERQLTQALPLLDPHERQVVERYLRAPHGSEPSPPPAAESRCAELCGEIDSHYARFLSDMRLRLRTDPPTDAHPAFTPEEQYAIRYLSRVQEGVSTGLLDAPSLVRSALVEQLERSLAARGYDPRRIQVEKEGETYAVRYRDAPETAPALPAQSASNTVLTREMAYLSYTEQQGEVIREAIGLGSEVALLIDTHGSSRIVQSDNGRWRESPTYGSIEELSPVNGGSAFIAEPSRGSRGMQRIVYFRDGEWKESPAYDRLQQLRAKDGELVCIATSASRGQVVLYTRNGEWKESPAYPVISSAHITRGKVVFQASLGSTQCAVYSHGDAWRQSPAYPEISLIATGTGMLAFTATRPDGQSCVVYHDGLRWDEGPAFDEIYAALSERDHIAFAAKRRNGTSCVVLLREGRSEKSRDYTSVYDLTSLGNEVVFLGTSDHSQCVVRSDRGAWTEEHRDRQINRLTSINDTVVLHCSDAKGQSQLIVYSPGGEARASSGYSVISFHPVHDLEGEMVFHARVRHRDFTVGDLLVKMTKEGDEPLTQEFPRILDVQCNGSHGTFIAQIGDEILCFRFGRSAPSVADSIALTSDEARKLTLLNLLAATKDPEGSSEAVTKFLTEMEPHLAHHATRAAHRQVTDMTNDLLRAMPLSLLDQVPATPDPDERATARFIARMFPELEARRRDEDLRRREAWSARHLAHNSHALPESTSLGSGDPKRVDDETAIWFDTPVHGFVVSGFLDRDGDRWRRASDISPSSLRDGDDPDEGVVHTWTISCTGNEGPLALPLVPDGEVDPRTIVGTTESGVPSSLEPDAAGMVAPGEGMRRITYSFRAPERIPLPREDISPRSYDTFLQRHGGEFAPATHRDLLPPDLAHFLSGIQALPPLSRAIAIVELVRKIGHYDFDHGEVLHRTSDVPIAERLARMTERMQELREGPLAGSLAHQEKKYAGVCADFAVLTAVLFEASGLRGGVATGFLAQGREARWSDSHAVAYLLWPREDGSPRRVLMDGTPPGVTEEERVRLHEVLGIRPEMLFRDETEGAVSPAEEGSEQASRRSTAETFGHMTRSAAFGGTFREAAEFAHLIDAVLYQYRDRPDLHVAIERTMASPPPPRPDTADAAILYRDLPTTIFEYLDRCVQRGSEPAEAAAALLQLVRSESNNLSSSAREAAQTILQEICRR